MTQSRLLNTRYPPVLPGTLWEIIVNQTRVAIQEGALHGIETEQVRMTDGGVNFLVRAVSSLRRKREKGEGVAKTQHEETFDPFLPPEPPLTLGELSATHIAVLNKFNVLDHHLLIVTRRFENQESLLTLEDMRAMAFVLAEIDGLGFYNAGQKAGASQRHKHLQLVPLPLIEGEALPIEAVFGQGLPFAHGLCALDDLDWRGAATPGELLIRYRGLLDEIRVGERKRGGGAFQAAPYNLLLTRRWMLAVPRACEHFGPISINSLGFAGSLFVRNRQEMALLRENGPMRVLRQVAGG